MEKIKVMTKLQEKVKEILTNMIKQVEEDNEYTQVYAEELDKMIYRLRSGGFFGAGSQCNPRGGKRG